MSIPSAQELVIGQSGLKSCVRMLSSPAGRFAQTVRFTDDPQGNYPLQWHATLTAYDKSETAEL